MTNLNVMLEPEVEFAMIRHAEQTFPFECCGFLFGNEDDGRTVSLAQPVKNSKEGDQRRRFEISPIDYIRAEAFALENHLQLLGVYHSHPNHPAIPSIHDREVAAPWFSYVIVSVTNGVFDHLRSWRIKDEVHEFEEEVLLSSSEA